MRCPRQAGRQQAQELRVAGRHGRVPGALSEEKKRAGVARQCQLSDVGRRYGTDGRTPASAASEDAEAAQGRHDRLAGTHSQCRTSSGDGQRL